jgi:hypothetical protein
MGRKVYLPLTQGFASSVEGAPTVDSMRVRLGGRIEEAPPPSLLAGSIVVVLTQKGGERLGVLLAGDEALCHVYLERGIVKRTRTDHVRAHEGDMPADLAGIARQVRLFAMLQEGQDVVVDRSPAPTQSGVLREKCRYGALVELPEGKLLGVGFAKLWPAPGASRSGSPNSGDGTGSN